MSLYLSSQPFWLGALLVVVLPTIAAMAGPWLVRRLFGLDHLMVNNEVAGFKFAVVGVTYAVLLGFVVIVVWQKFQDAQTAVTQEASASVALFRLSDGLDEKAARAVRQRLGDYVRKAVADDWPAMARGRGNVLAARGLDGLYAAVIAANPARAGEMAVVGEMLSRLDALTEARRTRLLLSTGVVPGVLWTSLYLGTVVTLAFTFFFGVESLRAQTLMTGMLALVLMTALLVAIEINYPFTGPVSVGPEPMRTALGAFGAGG